MQDQPPPTIRTIALGARPVSLLDTGAGPEDTLLLIHGAPGRPQDFQYVTPRLASRFRIIAPGLPGLGLTPLDSGPATDLPGRVDFLARLVEALDLGDLFIGGHSMGGGLAMLLADRLRDRVRGLVLLASIGLREHRGLRRFRPRLARALLDSPAQPLLTPVARAGFRAMGFPRGVSDSAMRHTVRCAAALDFDLLHSAAGRLSAPTLLACADDDPIIEPSIAEELGRVLPAGPRLRFATGGHVPMKPHARPIAEAIRDWADGLS